jgi:hypothetical protein
MAVLKSLPFDNTPHLGIHNLPRILSRRPSASAGNVSNCTSLAASHITESPRQPKTLFFQTRSLPEAQNLILLEAANNCCPRFLILLSCAVLQYKFGPTCIVALRVVSNDCHALYFRHLTSKEDNRLVPKM